MAKKKSECTPEEWAQHLAYMRKYQAAAYSNSPEYRARRLAEASTPERLARRRASWSTPEAIAKRTAYKNTAAAKARAKERFEVEKADPTKWALRLSRQRYGRTGFTDELLARTLESQGGACALCRTPLVIGETNVRADHCHESRQPRGVLCHRCNTAEGMIKKTGCDVSEWAARLMEYLKNPPAKRR